MRVHRAAGSWAAGSLALSLALAACGTSPVDESTDPSQPSGAPRLSLADCDEATPTGTVNRSAYGLKYSRGVMQVKIEPSDGRRSQCVEFAKWGNESVESPPDSLLFTFSGGNGEGGQFEFLASALTGERTPANRTVGELTDPISAMVGVSAAGTYYTAPACSLTLTKVSGRHTAGRFTCTQAVAQNADPFAPSDDVPYDEDPAPTSTPLTARLTGRFDVQR
ncbi:hypothetical protein L5G32_08565 [Gordonia sp. HY002]|uniref:hypothetical protein n=1 Tax=Gordonia zhenghanii TaxID=2911516 RepID=UPI001EEFA4AF|nr:hypothetical protein [Gordonia zhenghanii]MCF8570318.1 hypothetical protein [Gordonia zhenghanii]MCF8605934.1 hypothetical protein [Gordonia zhenghanii]